MRNCPRCIGGKEFLEIDRVDQELVCVNCGHRQSVTIEGEKIIILENLLLIQEDPIQEENESQQEDSLESESEPESELRKVRLRNPRHGNLPL